jgi:hypothetical protein
VRFKPAACARLCALAPPALRVLAGGRLSIERAPAPSGKKRFNNYEDRAVAALKATEDAAFNSMVRAVARCTPPHPPSVSIHCLSPSIDPLPAAFPPPVQTPRLSPCWSMRSRTPFRSGPARGTSVLLARPMLISSFAHQCCSLSRLLLVSALADIHAECSGGGTGGGGREEGREAAAGGVSESAMCAVDVWWERGRGLVVGGLQPLPRARVCWHVQSVGRLGSSNADIRAVAEDLRRVFPITDAYTHSLPQLPSCDKGRRAGGIGPKSVGAAERSRGLASPAGDALRSRVLERRRRLDNMHFV